MVPPRRALVLCSPPHVPSPSGCLSLLPVSALASGCAQHVCLDDRPVWERGAAAPAVPAPLCHGEVRLLLPHRARWVCTRPVGLRRLGRPPAPGLCLHAHHKLAGHKAQGFLERECGGGAGVISLSTERFSRPGSKAPVFRVGLSGAGASRGSLPSPAPPPLSSPSSRLREWERCCFPRDLCHATTRSLHPQWLQGTRLAAAPPGRVAALPLAAHRAWPACLQVNRGLFPCARCRHFSPV